MRKSFIVLQSDRIIYQPDDRHDIKIIYHSDKKKKDIDSHQIKIFYTIMVMTILIIIFMIRVVKKIIKMIVIRVKETIKVT